MPGLHPVRKGGRVFFITFMSCAAAIAVSCGAYGIATLTFSMMVGVLMAFLIEKRP